MARTALLWHDRCVFPTTPETGGRVPETPGRGQRPRGAPPGTPPVPPAQRGSGQRGPVAREPVPTAAASYDEGYRAGTGLESDGHNSGGFEAGIGHESGRGPEDGYGYGDSGSYRTLDSGGYGPDEEYDEQGGPGQDGRRETAAVRRERIGLDTGFVNLPPLRKGARADGSDEADITSDEDLEPVVVPVRRLLTVAIAGFAALLGVGLIVGAQTAGLGAERWSYAIVIFVVQALFVLTWTTATRPPAQYVVGAVGIAAALGADVAAVTPKFAVMAPLGYVAAAGFAAAVLGQLTRRTDRIRVTESLGSTLTLVIGVVAFATLVVLTRKPVGTQAITVCLTAAGVALVIARITDAFFARPRLAAQVPRGAAGVIVGAMCGTAAATGLGAYIQGFTPHTAAIVGMVTAGAAVLADLAANYADASRELAGDLPPLWLTRHMQGPLAGFALASPLAYLMSVLFLIPA
jgi:hypothetical protein